MKTDTIARMEKAIATREQKEKELKENIVEPDQKAKKMLPYFQKEYDCIKKCREKEFLSGLDTEVSRYYKNINSVVLKTKYCSLLIKILYDVGATAVINGVCRQTEDLAKSFRNQEAFLEIVYAHGFLLMEYNPPAAKDVFLRMSEVVGDIKKATPKTFQLIGYISKNLAKIFSKEGSDQARMYLRIAEIYHKEAKILRTQKK